mmetsp:Transcript_12011/g.28907  ORF Transcript_12011/g.28907 Transcript_12011/m.28907 type:complete len:87 (+) Transcript_12011:357-617(+)|eukprot:CAMPEP_0113465888 /NCGR_PEP_ID=MMETSP0014_2-20120614/13982_1 /TAXON_ID=2857 /ORGANISM="Nitzschia sp." /LENGTH=86 /DNA_ID=CAMNT_0000358081 /DNA_START=95 /DNA_END=355 /DNA_ORIENTATION=+ /assembly_acc=CAM_ASM_000159
MKFFLQVLLVALVAAVVSANDETTHQKKRLLRTSKRGHNSHVRGDNHNDNSNFAGTKSKDVGMMKEALEAGRELQMMSMYSMSMSM